MDPDLRRLLARVRIAAGLTAIPLILGADSGEPGTTTEQRVSCLDRVGPEACPTPEDALIRLAATDEGGCAVTAVLGDGRLSYFADSCCYDVIVTCTDTDTGHLSYRNNGCMGRPFRLDGAMARPGVRRRPARVLTLAAGMEPEKRAVLEAFWTEIAIAEHASVAEFHRAALDLLRFGAPEHLIAATQRAAIDEARHARRAFELASAYAGEQLSAGPLPLPTQVTLASSLAELARTTLRDGCGAETCSVWLYARLAKQVDDPTVRAVMDGIVRDETRHAALAWEVVRWALSQGDPAVGEAIREELDGVPPRPISVAVADDPELRRHGWAPAEEQSDIVWESWRAVVQPVAWEMLA